MRIFMLFFIVILTGCDTKRIKINSFFDRLDSVTSKNEKVQIKMCKDIGSLVKFADKHKLFAKELDSLPLEFDRFLSDSIKISESYYRKVALIMVYQKRLNNQKINFKEIKNKIDEYNKFNEEEYVRDYKKEIQVQLEIAKSNFDKFKVGDKLNLLFPLKKSGNFKEAYFNNFYYEKKYDDTLFLKCILMKKEVEKIDSFNFGHDEFSFSLKILEARNKDLSMVDKKYRKGNTIPLSLYNYGRNID